MKRFLFTITFLLFTCSSFAAEYSIKLFSWDSTYKEVTSYFMSNGWSMKLEDNLLHFDAPSKDDYFFINKLLKIKNVFFAFDTEGNIVAQSYTLDNDYQLSTAFMALLSAAINDSAVFYKQEYVQQNGLNNFYYYAHLPDNIDVNFMIVGKDDYYLLCISYCES